MHEVRQRIELRQPVEVETTRRSTTTGLGIHDHAEEQEQVGDT